MEFHQPQNIFNNKSDISEDKLSHEFYTLIGQEELTVDHRPRRLNDDDVVYAKKIQKKDGSYKNMIKLSNNGKLYNPVSVYGQEKTNDFLDRVCKSNNKFKTVNAKAFEWYVQFLASKNLAFFYNAEREVD